MVVRYCPEDAQEAELSFLTDSNKKVGPFCFYRKVCLLLTAAGKSIRPHIIVVFFFKAVFCSFSTFIRAAEWKFYDLYCCNEG